VSAISLLGEGRKEGRQITTGISVREKGAFSMVCRCCVEGDGITAAAWEERRLFLLQKVGEGIRAINN